MTPRKLAALRAMAAQEDSPLEQAIAAKKLRAAQEEAELDAEWRALWADQQEHERIAERQAAAARDAEVAAIVKRWERGTFSGVRVEVGATVPSVTFRSTKPR